VTDLLFRAGALAVLAPLVPISVLHNAMLMTRLFTNIVAAMDGGLEGRNVAEVWRHTQSSNAVNDIVHSNAQMREWAHNEIQDQDVVYQFMSDRSVGRLRPTHIYRDTEAVLVEMAEERGMGERVRAWLRNPGYVPESALYVFHGWPECMVLHDETWEEVEAVRNRVKA
jgi:hypothetical protein